MRTILRAVVIALWLVSVPIHCFSQAEGILTDTLKFRTAPSLKSKQTGTLKKGAHVTLLEANPTDGFYHVRASRNREGWIWAKSVKVLKAGKAETRSRKLVRRPASRELEARRPGEAVAVCQPDLASCPPSGCAVPDSPHGLANQLKRTVPTGSNTVVLTFDDFATLQQQADNLVGQDKELTADQRAQLKGLTVSNGQVSEGDLVSLAGYLVGTPHPNTGESVNCNLKQEQDNDFHIPFSNDPNNSDYNGIVIEMIPQNRPDIWNLANLTQVENNQQLVMVTGGLFYDNFHRVNGDPNNPQSGQPHRFALWEIHPITQFVVCTKMDNSCDPSQPGDWSPLGGG